jgi:hypothetical protein
MPSTQSLSPSHPVNSRWTALAQLAQCWASVFSSGFASGVILILLVRLQGHGDAGTSNDQIVQILAIALAFTLLVASLIWNRAAFRTIKAGYRIVTGIGAIVSLIAGVAISIETMRRPMDLVVTGVPRGDQVVQPSFTRR